MQQNQKQNIFSLHVLRGITSVGIIAFHTNLIMKDPKYGAIHAFDVEISRNWIGINLFFVLSGFIIMFAHGRDIGQRTHLPNYLWRRFSRIYPVYWIFLTLFIVAALSGLGYVNFRLTWGDMLSAYTLVQWVDNPTLPLKVAWTLVFEIFFYGMFALLVLNRLLGTLAFAAWLLVILVSAFVFHSTKIDWTSMWNINFFGGFLALFLYRRVDERWGAGLFFAGFVSLAMLLVLNGDYTDIESQQSKPLSLLLLTMPFVLIVAGAALAERRYAFMPPKLLLLFGEVSYASYLVHSAIISVCCLLIHRFAPDILPPEPMFILIFGLAVFGGVVAHFLVERPVIRATYKVAQLSTGIWAKKWGGAKSTV